MENWKDDIMNSLEGMERAKPKSDVFQKIQLKIRQDSLNKRQWFAVAASIVLVLCTNLYFILTYDATLASSETQELYSNIVNDFNIYN